jgi:hypothetical protein
MLPLLLGGLAGGLLSGMGKPKARVGVAAAMPAIGRTLAAAAGARYPYHRRRRRRLTQTAMIELTQIKSILGKTAAANALPFYLK